MPSLKIITPLLGGSYYHLFNRGVNRQQIFFQQRNYSYFLHLLDQFLSDYVHFLAYALLPNHFHLVIKLKEKISFRSEITVDEGKIGEIVINQIKRLFITYSMAINKQEGRKGSLFDPKYKRLMIEDNEYLMYAIFYTHFNPENHGITSNFRNYEFSSYKEISRGIKGLTDLDFVFGIFDDREGFISYHDSIHEERSEIELE